MKSVGLQSKLSESLIKIIFTARVQTAWESLGARIEMCYWHRCASVNVLVVCAPCVLVSDCLALGEQVNTIALLLPTGLMGGRQGCWSPSRPHPSAICSKAGVYQAQDLSVLSSCGFRHCHSIVNVLRSFWQISTKKRVRKQSYHELRWKIFPGLMIV